jgi:hypothetical protein
LVKASEVVSVVQIAVEGDTDEPVVRAVVRLAGHEPGTVYGHGGKARLDRRLLAYNQAARHAPWLVLRDLNGDEPCGGALARKLLRQPSRLMCFRVAVRSVEAWLLADHVRISQSLGVGSRLIPSNPDALADPKGKLIELARRSKFRGIREGLVPEAGTGAKVGPEYTSWAIDFATNRWRPRVAAGRSHSLERCIAALRSLPP